MSITAYLKMDGVEGECTVDGYKNWIEVVDFNLGETQPRMDSASAVAYADRVEHLPVTIKHRLDKATPTLHLRCCSGSVIQNAKLVLCRETGKQQPYFEVELKQVRVVTVKLEGMGDTDKNDLPLEVFAMSYGEITWRYIQTDHKDGRSLGNVQANWNLMKNYGMS